MRFFWWNGTKLSTFCFWQQANMHYFVSQNWQIDLDFRQLPIRSPRLWVWTVWSYGQRCISSDTHSVGATKLYYNQLMSSPSRCNAVSGVVLAFSNILDGTGILKRVAFLPECRSLHVSKFSMMVSTTSSSWGIRWYKWDAKFKAQWFSSPVHVSLKLYLQIIA